MELNEVPNRVNDVNGVTILMSATLFMSYNISYKIKKFKVTFKRLIKCYNYVLTLKFKVII